MSMMKIMTIKINKINTIGELLYKFSQIIHNKCISVYGIYDNQLTFDGLCYYNGKYHIMDYIYQLITETF